MFPSGKSRPSAGCVGPSENPPQNRVTPGTQGKPQAHRDPVEAAARRGAEHSRVAGGTPKRGVGTPGTGVRAGEQSAQGSETEPLEVWTCRTSAIAPSRPAARFWLSPPLSRLRGLPSFGCRFSGSGARRPKHSTLLTGCHQRTATSQLPPSVDCPREPPAASAPAARSAVGNCAGSSAPARWEQRRRAEAIPNVPAARASGLAPDLSLPHQALRRVAGQHAVEAQAPGGPGAPACWNHKGSGRQPPFLCTSFALACTHTGRTVGGD